MHVGRHAVGLLLARDDIDNAAHRIGAVEHRCRSAQHLHALGEHRLVGIGYGMPEHAHVLRMPVDEHQHLGVAPDAAHIDAAGRPVGNAVAHHAARGGEKSRHLLVEHRVERRIVAIFYRRPPDHGKRHRQMAHVGRVARAGDDYLAQFLTPSERVGRFCSLSCNRQACPREEAGQQK